MDSHILIPLSLAQWANATCMKSLHCLWNLFQRSHPSLSLSLYRLLFIMHVSKITLKHFVSLKCWCFFTLLFCLFFFFTIQISTMSVCLWGQKKLYIPLLPVYLHLLCVVFHMALQHDALRSAVDHQLWGAGPCLGQKENYRFSVGELTSFELGCIKGFQEQKTWQWVGLISVVTCKDMPFSHRAAMRMMWALIIHT